MPLILLFFISYFKIFSMQMFTYYLKSHFKLVIASYLSFPHSTSCNGNNVLFSIDIPTINVQKMASVWFHPYSLKAFCAVLRPIKSLTSHQLTVQYWFFSWLGRSTLGYPSCLSRGPPKTITHIKLLCSCKSTAPLRGHPEVAPKSPWGQSTAHVTIEIGTGEIVDRFWTIFY